MSVKFHEAFAFDSAQDHFWWMDHFLGDQIQDEWDTTFVGAGTIVIVDQQTGGIIRFTTGALNNDAATIDWNDIRSLHVNQRASMEIRMKLIQTNAVYASLRLRTLGTNDEIYFLYNSPANWYIYSEDGGAQTSGDTGISADTDYHIFRIECHTHGGSHVHFYIDGVETANSPITTNVPDDAGDYLQPWLYLQTKENVAKTMDVDYVAVRQDR